MPVEWPTIPTGTTMTGYVRMPDVVTWQSSITITGNYVYNNATGGLMPGTLFFADPIVDRFREAERVLDAESNIDRARHASRRRGLELLRSVLSEEQWSSYRAYDEFRVVGSNDYTYAIRRGTSGNVEKLDSRTRRRVRLCAHPRMRDNGGPSIPVEDVLAAQVLALRTDAEGFERVANIHAMWDENGVPILYDWDVDDHWPTMEFEP